MWKAEAEDEDEEDKVADKVQDKVNWSLRLGFVTAATAIRCHLNISGMGLLWVLELRKEYVNARQNIKRFLDREKNQTGQHHSCGNVWRII